MQHQRAMFWAFSDQQSIGLSVQSIDTSHRHFLSHQQPRFLQATPQLHRSHYFQQQATNLCGCFEELIEVSSSKKMLLREWKWIRRGVPLFWLFRNFSTDVSERFSNLAVHFT